MSVFSALNKWFWDLFEDKVVCPLCGGSGPYAENTVLKVQTSEGMLDLRVCDDCGHMMNEFAREKDDE